MKTKLMQKQIRFQALLLFFITFFLVELCAGFLYQNQLKEAKLKADYTAQTTIGRVKSQLNHYLAESNLMKHMIEAGYTVDDEEFSVLSSLMQDDQNVIKAHELAKDGIVTLIYPMSGNEAALGLNMLEHPARKQEARLAKESGEYTIAGPFELQQGDIGALLFDPIYTTDANGDQTFWGFSILVLDWEYAGRSRLYLRNLENFSGHRRTRFHRTLRQFPAFRCHGSSLHRAERHLAF